VEDCRTQLFEKLIARGHVSEVWSSWSKEHQGFTAGTSLIRNVLVSGLDHPAIHNFEFERRTIELHEELLVEELYKNGNLADQAIVRVSPLPDDNYAAVGKNYGYDYDSRKYMIRWIEVDDRGQRLTRTLSMVGSDTRLITQALTELGLKELETDELSSSGVLMTAFLVEKGIFPNGPIDLGRLIDKVTPGQVFLGKRGETGDYATLGEISKSRERSAENQVRDFAKAVIGIAASRQNQPEAYKLVLSKTIDSICLADPDMVREAIGEESYKLYIKARQASRAGETELAESLVQYARDSSNPLYSCGMMLSSQETGTKSTINSFLSGVCIEIRNGQRVRCPSCRQQTKAIVPKSKDRIYCSEKGCRLAPVHRREKLQPEKKRLKKPVKSTRKA
jgi:hypothetical protein